MTLNTAHLAGELDALDAEAATVAGDPTQPGSAPAAPEPPRDWTAEAVDLVTFAKELLVGTWPRLAEIWTAEKCASLARAAAPVMERYDFNLGRWAPEIMLAAVALPLGIQTVRIVKESKRAEAGQVPAVDTTEPGALHGKV